MTDVGIKQFFQFSHSTQVTEDHPAAGHVWSSHWITVRKVKEGKGVTLSDDDND